MSTKSTHCSRGQLQTALTIGSARATSPWQLLVASLISVSLVGCGQSSEYQTMQQQKQQAAAGGTTKKSADHDHGHDHDHDHHASGPHGGFVIELGNDEYHGEVLLDHDAHAIRVYLLDGKAKDAVTTAATSAAIAVEGGKKLSLAAKPAAGEPAGRTSTFELIDHDVTHELLDAGMLHGKLEVEIDGKAFAGEIDAHFDHDHDHAHENEAAATPAGDMPAGAAVPAEGSAPAAAPVTAEPTTAEPAPAEPAPAATTPPAAASDEPPAPAAPEPK